jgi:predicted RNA-binding Zn-ribbon protein involved in translation (DUF1610 family)
MVNFYYVVFVIGLFFIAIFIILWDWLSNRKSKKSGTKYAHICPKCKSGNVSPDFSLQTFGEGREFNKFKCNNCGHSSIFFPEIEKKKDKNSK